MSKLIFPNDFFEQEIRRGFVISEVMKRSWAAQIAVLEDVMDVCRKHSLKMFACYGTLLGAIREHGFIPWDDDIDIGFVGEDYIMFLDIFLKEAREEYRILNPYTRSWYNMNFSRITNAGDISFAREYLNKWFGCPFMTGLDVYPYYYIPRRSEDEQYILSILGKIDYVIGLNKQLVAQTDGKVASELRNRLNETVAIKLVDLQKETGYIFDSKRPIENQLEILYDQVCRITTENEADYVARYDEYTKDKRKKFPKEYFSATIQKPFENVTIPVPLGYDAVLRTRFGDSFIIPKNEPSAHDYPCYSKQFTDEEYYRLETQYKGIDQTLRLPIKSGHGKTLVLYHTGVRQMLMNCELAINKIRNVLSYFENVKDDVEVLWMPDIFLKTNEAALEMVAPKLVQEYEKIVETFVACKGYICDINTSLEQVVSVCDKYYGDDGVIADQFRLFKKPVVIQDYSSDYIELDCDYCYTHVAELGEYVQNKNPNKHIEIPDEWVRVIYREDGSKKKVILYSMSISILYQYKERIMDKIRNVLEVFRSNSDNIALVWYPQFDELEIKDFFEDVFFRDYKDLIKEYSDEGWGIFDTSNKTELLVEVADALYGDPGEIMMQFNKAGKPVMVEDPMIY